MIESIDPPAEGVLATFDEPRPEHLEEPQIEAGLRGRVALVAGATEGPGRVIARLFAAQGAWVAVSFRADYQRARSLVDEIRANGGRALVVPGDVRTPEGAWSVARYVEHEWAQIDVLLHAGGLVNADEIATDPTPLISELAPDMRARGWGRVVVIKGDRSDCDSESDGCNRSDPYAHWSGNCLLINTLLVRPDSRPACVDEVAQAALYFGSARNPGITGAQISICAAESGPPGSPKRREPLEPLHPQFEG